MDALKSIREFYEETDSDEEIKPSKRLKSSESMNPGHHRSTPSSSPTIEPSQLSPVNSVDLFPPIDAIQSIREMYEKIDPVEQIDPLVSLVETQLHKMNNQSEEGSSSSELWLETVGDGTKIAATTIDTISTEAEKLSILGAVEAMRSLTLKVVKGIGELHSVFIGLSVAAFAGGSYMRVSCTENECREILLKILELAQTVKQYSKQMYERGKLCNAVVTILEGAVICCDYLTRGEIFRFWSATTAAVQLEKANQELRDVRDSFGLSSLQKVQQLLDIQWRKDYGGDKDVFLSHSGKQKNFVRQLYQDLTREHVSCFLDEDDKSLPLAQKFPPLIFKHAETCKIAILVLSKEFIRSKWPMLELSAFIRAMNSGKNTNLRLFPIFFMISPKELHITKDSPEWKKLEVSNDTRGEWQAALKVVRSINGLHFGEDGNEVVFRDKVVKQICCILKRINPESHLQLLDFKPVGIEEQVEEVKALLDMEGAQSALAVIVCGFGGVGKTTLAASVVQSLDWSSTDFKFCMVAIDEKTPDKTSHIMKLQKNILHDLGGVKAYLRDPLDGRSQIKKTLKNKCSLLFIDNVVDKDYIQNLLPKDLWSGEQETKLRIIITSREKNVKAELNILCKEYEMKGLSDAASKSLLLEAIQQNQEVDITLDEERRIEEVAEACKGVPLLLSVFGKHLRMERDEDSYQEALDVLRKGDLDSYRDEDLDRKLMFVYHKIKNEEVKEAFLDICAYFHGWKWNLVADIVDIRTLRDLHRRVLVSRSGSDEVIVHDILRLMGMKEAGLTRVSNYKEFSDALEGNLNVKGISLVSSDNLLITIQSTELEATHQSLRVLMLGNWITLEGPPCHGAFRNLICLRLGDISAFPFEDPSKLVKLRVFLNRSQPGMNLSYLPNSLKRISHEVPYVECNEFAKLPFQNLSSLKTFMVETPKSVKLPEEFHLPASLVDLDLSRCKNLPKDIGHLTALESLVLDRSDLKCLPEGFDKLKKLKHLSLDYCSKLASLSEGLGMLSSLESLSMKNCQNLKALPKSLGGLISLQELNLRGSINLQLLPETLGDLRIHKLEVRSLVNLHELPNSFGNMPFLKYLFLESCESLVSLPDSFVQLKMLETLIVIKCNKFSILPEDFGRLRYLERMTVADCHLFQELPGGFGALPALKTFELVRCNSFLNLPTDFTELTSLEELRVEGLPLISRIPDGLGKLKRLRFLYIVKCFQLKTLPDDFENMATLERLTISYCHELVGAMMEKILKLQNCSMANIAGSIKLLAKWKQMQREIEHPIAVLGDSRDDQENRERAIRVCLLNGKYLEMNNTTDQLMERSSLFVGLEEGRSATLALIMLPIHIQSHQHEILQRFVEMASETAKTNGSGKLQIVCARKCVWSAQRPTPTEEDERAEEEDIRRILLLLPKGSCTIPSSEFKRVRIITWCCHSGEYGYYDRDKYAHQKLSFFMANVGIDIEGRKSFENLKFTKEYMISENVVMEPQSSSIWKPENKHYNSFQRFFKSIRGSYVGETDSYVGETDQQSKTREFTEALKGNGIDYLVIDHNTSKMIVDDLHKKTISFIMCDFKLLECIKLQQIYKDLQQRDRNFIAIWIPTVRPEDCGHGAYTRLIQGMPWATFPPHQLINVESGGACFIVLDKEGKIANLDASALLLAWGVESYPFTQRTIPQSFFMESESCLEFLLHGMNIVGRKPMKRKMTFLYAESPTRCQKKMMCKLEELTNIHGNFEVLYVGQYTYEFADDLKQDYEDATQNMCWPSLSLSDMIIFWNRCKYLGSREGYELNKESNIMMETLHGLATQLFRATNWLVLVDNDGAVTTRGSDVLQMICDSSHEISNAGGMTMVKNELMESLSRGESTPFVKTFFRDEIDDLPQHSQHRLEIPYPTLLAVYKCNVCFRWKHFETSGDRSYTCWNQQRSYRCYQCEWDMCGSCWRACAKQQAEQLHCKR